MLNAEDVKLVTRERYTLAKFEGDANDMNNAPTEIVIVTADGAKITYRPSSYDYSPEV